MNSATFDVSGGLQWVRGPKTAVSASQVRQIGQAILVFNGSAVRRPRLAPSATGGSAAKGSLQWVRGPKTAVSTRTVNRRLKHGLVFNGSAVRRPRLATLPKVD